MLPTFEGTEKIHRTRRSVAKAEAEAEATLSTRRCCCIVSSLIVYLHIFSNVLCSPSHTYLYLYLYLYFYSYSYAHSYLALTLILEQCVLRSQRLCATPALLFCHLTFVDNLHTFYLFQYCCFSLVIPLPLFFVLFLLLLLRSENLFCG